MFPRYLSSKMSNLLIYKIFVILGVVLLSTFTANGERTKDKMYESIKGGAACFRRLNGTHQTGCSSSRSGSTGVVHIVKTEEDIEWILKNSSAGPYIPVIPTEFFTREILTAFKNNFPDIISGVILSNVTQTTPEHFSHDAKCPNDGYGLEGTCKANLTGGWNKFGTNIMHEDYPFPIFYVSTESEYKKLKDCFGKFNKDLEGQKTRSLCAIELSAFMLAAVDTPTCLRRSNVLSMAVSNSRVCDALGDRNVWSTLFPRETYSDEDENNSVKKEAKKEKIILVAARLDATSMFDETARGAVSTVSGLVTLLSVAEFLTNMSRDSDLPKTDKNVLFVIFNGEAYDYLGSQRIVYDMERGYFPLKPDSKTGYQVPNITLDAISLFIEISQLSKTSTLNVHHAEYQDPSTSQLITNIINQLNENSKPYSIQFTERANSVPPSSLQTFLNTNKNVPGIVIANHDQNYINNYYNSFYDNAANLEFEYYNSTDGETVEIPEDSIQSLLNHISFTIAKVVYKEVFNTTYNSILDNKQNINELLYCYLITSNCALFREATYKETLQDKAPSLYIGVIVWDNPVTTLTGYTLALLTGDRDTNITKDACKYNSETPAFRYIWINGFKNGTCVKTTMNFTQAVSPAFEIEDYDWKSGKYSSWAESIWREFNVRIFLKPSAAHEIFTISIGSVVMVLSFIVVYFMNKKADVLFNTNPNIIGTSC